MHCVLMFVQKKQVDLKRIAGLIITGIDTDTGFIESLT